MDNRRIAKELTRIAKSLMSAKSVDQLWNVDIERAMKEINEYEGRYGDYNFNIKMYRINIPDWVRGKIDDDDIQRYVDETAESDLENLFEELKKRYKWVRKTYQAGRSGGWLAIEAGDDLEDTASYNYGYKDAEALEDDLKTMKQRVKDLGVIDKLVKSSVKAFSQHVSSEDFWKDALEYLED